MFKAHQGKYSFINKHQDNFFFFFCRISHAVKSQCRNREGPSSTNIPALGTRQPFWYQTQGKQSLSFTRGLFSVNPTLAGCGKVQMGLYIPSWCTLPTNTSVSMVLDHIREDRQACSSLCCDWRWLWLRKGCSIANHISVPRSMTNKYVEDGDVNPLLPI